MIKLQAIGHLGKDAVVNTVNSKTVINFSVAHSEKWRDAQGREQTKTIWVECAYWTDRTNVSQYLKKGTQVHVDGQPDIREWKTQDGKSGASLILRVQHIQLLGSSQGAGNSTNQVNQATYREFGGSNQQAAPTPADITEPLDDLPF